MISLSASLSLRPTRIGFLVDPRDLPSLRRIFQVNTCLWGGAYNPIIPVGKSLPDEWKRKYSVHNPSAKELARGYIDFFEPDVFVEATAGLTESIDLDVRNLDFDRPRVVPLDTFFERPHEEPFDVPFGTNVVEVLQRYL